MISWREITYYFRIKLTLTIIFLATYKDEITNRQFRKMLEAKAENAVSLFAKYCWARIPQEMRLVHLDEAQLFHIENAEFLLLRHKLNQVSINVEFLKH